MATNNAINVNSTNPLIVTNGGTGASTLTGVLTGNGTSAVIASAITQYGTVVAGVSNAVASIAPSATSGVPYISQGAAANPAFGTAVVAGGGTGVVSTTAYAVLCGGTTSTAALQSIASVGVASQVLTSNGPGLLPTFQAAAGGAVSSVTGTASEITASPTTGAVILTIPSTFIAPGTIAATTTVTAGTNILTTNGDVTIANTSAAVTAPFLNFRKSRSGGIITTGDDIGEISFAAHDGSTFFTSARIRADSSGTIAAGRVASALQFYTAPDSVTASTLRLTINPTGAVDIAGPVSAATYTLGLTSAAGKAALFINGESFLTYPTTRSCYIGAGAGLVGATGTSATGVGFQTLSSLTSGNYNTCLGAYAGIFLTTGSTNTLIGAISTGTGTAAPFGAGGNYTGAESHNICINSAGTTGESNALRIGAGTGTGTAQLNKAFIHGIRGITTVNADAIAVLVDSAGQLGTVSSSIRFKENVVDMDDESAPVMELRPVTFNYKSHPGKKQYGLIAEEVLSIIPELVVYNEDGDVESVKYHDLPVLLLNELQRLAKRVAQLERNMGMDE